MRITEILDKNWLFRKGDICAEKLNEIPISGVDSWHEVTIPHDWAIDGPFDGWHEPLMTIDKESGTAHFEPGNNTGALPYSGCGTYICRLEFPEEWKNKVLRLEFDGVMSRSTVFVNGRKAGGCNYGYTSFAVDITNFAKFGKSCNIIAVKVENPLYLTRWYPGAGIFREVRLTVLEQKHLAFQNIHLKTAFLDIEQKKAVLEVVCGGTDSKDISVTVRRNAKQIAAGGNVLEISDVELWSPENPALYQVEVSTPADSETVNYGFREIVFDAEKGMFLNGKRYRVNGLCMHHDLGVIGAAFDKDIMRWRLKKIKALNCNALRMAHNPPDPKLLDLCDEMGFLVMDEAFDVWKSPKTAGDYHNIFDESSQDDLRSMLRRDRNHPCVFLWSIGNEIADELLECGKNLAKKLVDICHEESPDRPVTCAINHQQREDNANIHAFADTLDVLGFNYQPELYPILHERFPGKPMFGSETAAVNTSRGEYLPAEGQPYSSSYASEYAVWSSSSEDTFEALEKYPFLFGEFAWCTFDYLGEPFPFKYPARSSAWGLFDLAGLAKDRAFYYAAQWHKKGEKDILHILPHWDWKDGETIQVHAFTSCSEVELFLNGRSLGRRKKELISRLIWKDVRFEKGTLEAAGFDENGTETIRVKHVTPDEPADIGTKIEIEKRENQKGFYAFIEVFMTDKNGNSIDRSEENLTFDIENGKLVGTDNGDSCSLLPFKRSYTKLHRGKAMITVSFDRQASINISNGKITKTFALTP